MKKMTIALAVLWMAGEAFAAESAWLTSVPEALAQARREHKLALLDFTGSDWCGWCKKLNADTFSKPEFIEYASRNLVLVEIDFPKHKEQSDDLKQANKALKAKYGVKGFPTLVVLEPDGTVVWKKVGYLAGGPEAMISKINEARSTPGARNEAPVAPPVAPPVSGAPAVLMPAQWPAPPAHLKGEEPRLQGIFYSTSHPSVVLEGKSCGEWDSVEGMRVLRIAPDHVTVQWNGTTEDLRMN